jgi:hypothetical protein
MQINSLNLNGVAGNQRLKPNKSSNNTLDALISPVTPEELADFLSIDYSASDDALYEGFLLAATDMCIKYTNIELIAREYTFKSDYYPNRQDGFAGVSLMYAYRSWWVNLPLYPVIEITSVKVNDTEADDPLIDLDSRPARVEPKELGKLEIEYTAGHASVEEINPQLLLGIKMLAAYLYEHRGACDVADAVKQSGAATLWNSARMVVSL